MVVFVVYYAFGSDCWPIAVVTDEDVAKRLASRPNVSYERMIVDAVPEGY